MQGEVVTNPYRTPKSPFREDPIPAEVPSLMLRGPWAPEIAAYMSSNELRGLYLNYTHGWTREDYAFLRELPWLQLLDIVDVPIDDLSPVNKLHALTTLHLNARTKGVVNFASLEQLLACSFTWWNGASSIFECSELQELDIRSVKEADLGGVSKLHNLRTLTLQSNIRSLAPMSGLERLQKLVLLNCRNLEDLSGLADLPNLRWLAIDGSKKVRDFSPVAKLAKLEVLDLSDIGIIPSLAPLATLKKLRALAFTGVTNSIEDGDLSVLESLPDLSMLMFAPRKHYTHSLLKQWDWNDFYQPTKLLEAKAR